MTAKTPREETRRIEGLIGPYAGQLIDIPTEDAKVAIADKWARDPFAERDTEVPYTTSDDIEAISAKAIEASVKLQTGEALVAEPPPPEPEIDLPDEDEDEDGTGTRRKKTKAVQAEDSGTGYKTRGSRGKG